MQLIDAKIRLDSNIFLIGDTHDGARLMDSDGWEAMTEMVNSPYDGCANNYVVDHGDAIEGILVDDPRYGISETMESRTLMQIKSAVKRRGPIAKKILAFLMGNHEYKLQKFGDVSKHMADELGVQYGTYSAKLSYSISNGRGKERFLFKHFATHGYGTMLMQAGDEEQRIANKKVKLKRMLRFKASDCYMQSMGHTHQLLVRSPLIKLHMTDDGEKLKQVYDKPPEEFHPNGILHEDMRWYVNTGCFLKTLGINFSSYSERKGFDPAILGFAVAIIRGGRLVNIREERI